MLIITRLLTLFCALLAISPTVGTADCISQLNVINVRIENTTIYVPNSNTYTPGENIRIIADINNAYGAWLLATNGTILSVKTSFYSNTKSVDIPPGTSTWTWNATSPYTEGNYTVTVGAYDHFCGQSVSNNGNLVVASGHDDYPESLCPPNHEKRDLIDPWNFFNRECTSFVAWRLNQSFGFPAAFNNNLNGERFGSAYEWYKTASKLGMLDASPSPRDVVWFNANTAGAGNSGHVAWVQSVNTDGSITIEDYNWLNNGLYRKNIVIPVSTVSKLRFFNFGKWFYTQLQQQKKERPAITLPPNKKIETFRDGSLVFFRLFFTDLNNDAIGFGFQGVNGSGWARETHPFLYPSYGRISTTNPPRLGSVAIEYPFNLRCGTPSAYDSAVEAWIYDRSGIESKHVTIPLSCSAVGKVHPGLACRR